jgi:heme/copper-type cytochrome/quinol oxidase subunit 2|tara:strand:+ start:356 stop:547 length:192 start_codon:yes stop_codon:yes gene_type:complete
MFGKFGILIIILVLIFLFFIVISYGAGAFSKNKVKPETKRYLKSVNILLTIIAIVGVILVLFL